MVSFDPLLALFPAIHVEVGTDIHFNMYNTHTFKKVGLHHNNASTFCSVLKKVCRCTGHISDSIWFNFGAIWEIFDVRKRQKPNAILGHVLSNEGGQSLHPLGWNFHFIYDAWSSENQIWTVFLLVLFFSFSFLKSLTPPPTPSCTMYGWLIVFLEKITINTVPELWK